MSKVIIDVKNLTNKFGKVVANDNVSLQIKEGERVAFLGANGAGKTTLIESIIGTTKPKSGKIIRSFGRGENFKEEIGVQFQDAKYPSGLLVSDIIEFINAVGDSKLDKKVLEETLKRFRMSDFYDNPANSLSGGQAQKLNVLLALVNYPKVLILDEVSTGLDIQARSEIKKFIKEYLDTHKTTLLLISHDMAEVQFLCDRVIAMDKGKIVLDSTVEDIVKKYKDLDKFLESVVIGK